METLKYLLKESKIDDIEDDEEFMLKENDFIREYCYEHSFNLTEEDMNIIKSRGLMETYDDWKFKFEIDKET